MKVNIPNACLEDFKGKLEKLVKRGKKLGCPVKVQYGESFTKTNTDGKTFKFTPVEVSGNSPKINGWSFVATLQHKDGVNVIRAINDNPIPESYRVKPEHCDHCNVNRYRVDTYIVKNEEGDFKQVGRSCLKDFTGHKNPEALADWYANFGDLKNLTDSYGDDFEGGFAGWGGNWNCHSIMHILAIAADEILENGFMSRTEANGRACASTGDIVKEKLFDKNLKVSETGKSLANNVFKFVKENFSLKSDSQYGSNLAAIFSQDFCETRDIGIVSSAVIAYQRDVEKKIREKNKVDMANSKYFGQIKKREEFTLTVLKTFTFESFYGTIWMYQMIDENGNVAIWKTGSAVDMNQGSTYKIKATVKAHEEYKGVNQTVLTRCKLLEELKKQEKVA